MKNGDIIYSYFYTDVLPYSMPIGVHFGEDIMKISDTEFRSSILISTGELPICEELIFEIDGVRLMKGDQSPLIDGSWVINVKLDSKFVERTSEYYEITYDSEYIESATAELSEMSLKINIKFYENVEEAKSYNFHNIILKNSIGNEFILQSGGFDSEKDLELKYDIGKYTDNVENLYLEILANEKN